MALFATQEINYAGTTPTYAAVAATDTFTPDEWTFIHVKNTNAATRTITVTTFSTSVGGVAVADVGPVTIAATTGEEMLGPFPARHFADPATGLATVTYSATPGVVAAVLRLSPVFS